jgi:hypothetical protein
VYSVMDRGRMKGTLDFLYVYIIGHDEKTLRYFLMYMWLL